MQKLKTVGAVHTHTHTHTHTSNSIKITEGGNTFFSDNKKQADYIK